MARCGPMIRRQWEDLVVHNPMLIEVTRFQRRYFSVNRGTSVNALVLGLFLILYALIVMTVIENRGTLSPFTLLHGQTVLFAVFGPMMLYGAVAGERERRSWDLLLAAPVTKSQIIAGKFMGAMAALGVAFALMQVPLVIAARSYVESRWQVLLVGDLMSLTFAMCVCALTILLSARVKRGLMALGATLGSLVSLLVVVPMLTGMGSADSHIQDVAFFMHPFYALNRLSQLQTYQHIVLQHLVWSRHHGPTDVRPPMPPEQAPVVWWWGWPQVAVYVVFALILLAWAINTLNFAENEVKFLPQGHKDA